MSTHGHTMMPNNSPKARARKPSGTMPPSSGSGSSSDGNNQDPLPVALTRGTFIKFALTMSISLLIGISTILGFYWAHYWRVSTHMENQTIHLDSGERKTLETKVEAKQERKKMVKEIKAQVDLKHREVLVQQKEQIQKIGGELKTEQRQALNRILSEVRQSRRETRRAITGY